MTDEPYDRGALDAIRFVAGYPPTDEFNVIFDRYLAELPGVLTTAEFVDIPTTPQEPHQVPHQGEQ